MGLSRRAGAKLWRSCVPSDRSTVLQHTTTSLCDCGCSVWLLCGVLPGRAALVVMQGITIVRARICYVTCVSIAQLQQDGINAGRQHLFSAAVCNGTAALLCCAYTAASTAVCGVLLLTQTLRHLPLQLQCAPSRPRSAWAGVQLLPCSP